MPVYFGPCSYGTVPSSNFGEKYITDEDDENEISGPALELPEGQLLDMKNQRIANLGQPLSGRDAATASYVNGLVSAVNNRKVEWTGGTMTGELSMGSHKLTHVGDPENDEDAVNKQYMFKIIDETRPFDLGRYLVFPHTGSTKSYFAVGSKRNIDLDSGKLKEYFNGYDEQGTKIVGVGDDGRPISEIRLIPDSGESASLMEFYGNRFKIWDSPTPKPWTFLFSTKSTQGNDHINMDFRSVDPLNPVASFNISISWSSADFIEYIIISNARAPPGQPPVQPLVRPPVSIRLNNEINHFAFRYAGQKLTVWVNGVLQQTHNDLLLGNFDDLQLSSSTFGVISLYNRELNKPEIVEHFIQKHVIPFTNDEVYS